MLLLSMMFCTVAFAEKDNSNFEFVMSNIEGDIFYVDMNSLKFLNGGKFTLFTSMLITDKNTYFTRMNIDAENEKYRIDSSLTLNKNGDLVDSTKTPTSWQPLEIDSPVFVCWGHVMGVARKTAK
jgi:hypothetical protein